MLPESQMLGAYSRGAKVHALVWGPTERSVRRGMSSIVDGWGSGVDVAVGGFLGSGTGFGFGFEGDETTVMERSPAPGAPALWCSSAVGTVTGPIEWDSMRKRAALEGLAIELFPVDYDPTRRTVGEFGVEVLDASVAAARNAAQSVGEGIGALARNVGSGVLSGIGPLGVAAVALGAGAVVVAAVYAVRRGAS